MEYLLGLNTLVCLFWAFMIDGSEWQGIIAKVIMTIFCVANFFAAWYVMGYIAQIPVQ